MSQNRYLAFIGVVAVIGLFLFVFPIIPVSKQQPYETIVPFEVQGSLTLEVPYTTHIPCNAEVNLTKTEDIIEIDQIFKKNSVYRINFTLYETRDLIISWNANKELTLYAIINPEFADLYFQLISVVIKENPSNLIGLINQLAENFSYYKINSKTDYIIQNFEAENYTILFAVTDAPLILSNRLSYEYVTTELQLKYREETRYINETMYITETRYKTETHYREVKKTVTIWEFVTKSY